MLLLSILNSNPCQSSLFLKILLLVENLITLICVIVPIGLLIITSIDIFKNVVGNEDTMRKSTKTIIQRMITCILIFLVPSLVNLTMYIINSALGDDTISIASCYGNITLEDIKLAEEQEELEKEYYETEEDKKYNDHYVCTYQSGSTTGYSLTITMHANNNIGIGLSTAGGKTSLDSTITNFNNTYKYGTNNQVLSKWYQDSYFEKGKCPTYLFVGTGTKTTTTGSSNGATSSTINLNYTAMSETEAELKTFADYYNQNICKEGIDFQYSNSASITTSTSCTDIILSLTSNTATNTINKNKSNSSASKITYYNQADSAWATHSLCTSSSGKTIKSSGCGPTSLAMMASTFGVYSTTPITMVDWLCDNGHTNGALPKSFFTNQALLSHFKIKGQLLFDNGNNKGNAGTTYSSSDGGKILNAVQSGKGVIIYIPGHYLAVGPNPSCSTNQVYIYDSGNRSFSGCITPQELFEKTYNRSNRCTSNGNCGWKAAWAYSSAN